MIWCGTLRRDVTIPLVFMTYANVVFSYGAERFFVHLPRRSASTDIILPDLPYEEKEEFLPACRKYGVDADLHDRPYLCRTALP